MLCRIDMDILVFKYFLSISSSVFFTFWVLDTGSTKAIKNNRYGYFLYSVGGTATAQVEDRTDNNVKSCNAAKVDIDESVVSSNWLERYA